MATQNGINSRVVEVEVDFGSTELEEKSFTVVDATVNTGSLIMLSISGNTPSDGRDIDEVRVENMQMLATPGSGQFTLNMNPKEGTTTGKFKVLYFVIG